MAKDKILIIDDDQCLASTLTEILKTEGYGTVAQASNGLDGLNMYKKLRPDLVLMDIEMPVMDGYESSRQIKAFDPAANILILTGSPDCAQAKRTIKEGFAAVILKKPLKWTELGSAIRCATLSISSC